MNYVKLISLKNKNDNLKNKNSLRWFKALLKPLKKFLLLKLFLIINSNSSLKDTCILLFYSFITSGISIVAYGKAITSAFLPSFLKAMFKAVFTEFTTVRSLIFLSCC